MATFDYNPITGNLDLVGSGASYINGVVADPTALPVTVGTPPLDSVYLAKSGSGVWLINRRPSGLYCRVANNGNLNDWVALGAFPEINADGNWELYNSADPTKELKFDLSAIATGNTRTISVPNKNVTLDDVSDARTPTAHNHAASAITSGVFDNARINFAAPDAIGSTTRNTGSFTNLSASAELAVPAVTPASPSAGDLFRTGNLIQYQDGSNTTRTLLNATDNLSNVADANTARINLSAAPALVRSSSSMSSNVSLSAGRARHITYTLLGGSYQVTLPLTGNQSGDVCRLTNGASSLSGAILTVVRGNGLGGTIIITTLEKNQTVTCFNRDGTETGWTLEGVDTHTHAASEITSGVFANSLINFAAPSAIGSTTAAAITGTTGTFSTLSANNGTQTSTAFAPALTLSQTWNTSGHVFSAFTIDITNTASSSNSTFLICRAGGNSAFEFRTGGNLVVPASGAFNCSGTVVTSGQVSVNSGGSFAFTSSSTSGFSGQDTFIRRDAASILAQYNGTNAQVWRLYSTVSGTGNANFERLAITAQAADSFLISTQKGGTGSARGLILRTDDTARLTFGASGTITLNTTLAADAQNISTDTTTGTKIGTGTTQKIGFFNATPVTQRAAIADATDAATTQARLNDLLAAMRSLGLIAT